jgi:hypothetical protein
MASMPAITSPTPISVSVLDRSRLVQARRDADAAQAKADELRDRADQADRAARTSQDNANDLAERSQQMEATYGRQHSGAARTGRILDVRA